MSDEFNLMPDEIEMERQLGTLVPQPSLIDERTIWFEAGVRRGRKSGHRWQVATAASLALALGSFSWNGQTRTAVVQQPHTQPAPVANRLPGSGARSDSGRMTDEHTGIEDLLEVSGWRIDANALRPTQPSTAAPTDTLSASQMLERSINPKDFLTMRS